MGNGLSGDGDANTTNELKEFAFHHAPPFKVIAHRPSISTTLMNGSRAVADLRFAGQTGLHCPCQRAGPPPTHRHTLPESQPAPRPPPALHRGLVGGRVTLPFDCCAVNGQD